MLRNFACGDLHCRGIDDLAACLGRRTGRREQAGQFQPANKPVGLCGDRRRLDPATRRRAVCRAPSGQPPSFPTSGLPFGRLSKRQLATDLEVRDRVRDALKRVVRADVDRRWTAFVDDMNDTKHDDVSGWSRFRQVIGHDRAARQLFAEMHRAEPDLFKAIDKGPAATAQALETCINEEILQMPIRIVGGNSISLASVCAMLFAGSDSHVTLAEGSAIQLTMAVARQPAIRQAVVLGDQCATVKKVLGAWISRDATENVLSQNLWLATQLDVKEGLEPAVHAHYAQPNQSNTNQAHCIGANRQTRRPERIARRRIVHERQRRLRRNDDE